jgi:arylsulfatase A-like enzyme
MLRRLCWVVALFAVGTVEWGLVAAEVAARPNVVFILADDLGYGDVGCYGHPYARTPNIDKLASEGTRFTQFYSTGVTCCPARTGLMTSKFPATFREYPANGGFGERVTITDLLKQAGYHTGHFGKWHIGPEEKDGTYGIDTVGTDGGEKQTARRDGSRGRDAHIFDDAIGFIEKHKARPFYVNVWCHISHHPVNPSAATLERFGSLSAEGKQAGSSLREKIALCEKLGGDANEHLRRYLADVFSLDEDVGRLLKRIDDLGLRENTIVVYSSDQGAAPLRASDSPEAAAKKKKKNKGGGSNDSLEIRLNAMGSAGSLRGGKHEMLEGGVRVPFIVRWPGHTPAGRVDQQSVISGIDWLPTLCKLAGVALPQVDMDGEDASAAWLGGTFSRTKALLWKVSNPNSDLAIREGQWKLYEPRRRRGAVELYDIGQDHAESKNLAADKPDVVKALSAKLQAWNATLPKEYIKAEERDEE